MSSRLSLYGKDKYVYGKMQGFLRTWRNSETTHKYVLACFEYFATITKHESYLNRDDLDFMYTFINSAYVKLNHHNHKHMEEFYTYLCKIVGNQALMKKSIRFYFEGEKKFDSFKDLVGQVFHFFVYIEFRSFPHYLKEMINCKEVFRFYFVDLEGVHHVNFLFNDA